MTTTKVPASTQDPPAHITMDYSSASGASSATSIETTFTAPLLASEHVLSPSISGRCTRCLNNVYGETRCEKITGCALCALAIGLLGTGVFFCATSNAPWAPWAPYALLDWGPGRARQAGTAMISGGVICGCCSIPSCRNCCADCCAGFFANMAAPPRLGHVHGHPVHYPHH